MDINCGIHAASSEMQFPAVVAFELQKKGSRLFLFSDGSNGSHSVPEDLQSCRCSTA